ncbi:MAG: DUF5060 domain-containing protein, partial [Planctomycetota bacterium]
MPPSSPTEPPSVHDRARRWQPVTLYFSISLSGWGPDANPYVQTQVEVTWRHDLTGREIVRPAYWCGGERFAVRFASPEAAGSWQWAVSANGQASATSRGTLEMTPGKPADAFEAYGPLKMSVDGRSVVHHDGRSFLMVADTPWALPFRATPETALQYAADREAKGFNAALLMVVQPDM